MNARGSRQQAITPHSRAFAPSPPDVDLTMRQERGLPDAPSSMNVSRCAPAPSSPYFGSSHDAASFFGEGRSLVPVPINLAGAVSALSDRNPPAEMPSAAFLALCPLRSPVPALRTNPAPAAEQALQSSRLDQARVARNGRGCQASFTFSTSSARLVYNPS